MNHSKRYRAASDAIDAAKSYPVTEAVALAKKTSTVKFDASVEVHFRLGIDAAKADQMVRDVVVLPNGLGKTVRVLVFAQGEGATIAQKAGADIVADDLLHLTRLKQVQVKSAVDRNLKWLVVRYGHIRPLR